MQKNFDIALKHVLKYEGGYVDHPADPGGATNLGITQATLSAWRQKKVSKADVKNLTVAEAAKIYKKQYWDTCSCDELPSGVDFCVFDYSVNSGPSRAARSLQQLVGASVDGVIGAGTRDKINNYDPAALVNAYLDSRLEFLKRIKDAKGGRAWDTFGKGWSARIAAVRKASLALVGGRSLPTPAPIPETPKAPPPAPIPPKKSKSLWSILFSFVTGSGGLTYLSGIDTWPKVAFAALLLVALGIGLWLVLSGRIKLKQWFELEEPDAGNTLESDGMGERERSARTPGLDLREEQGLEN